MSEVDYKAVCTDCDIEDWGINVFCGTIVIDGALCTWNCQEEADGHYKSGLRVYRVPSDGEKASLKQRQVAISRRKDYLRIHGAINQAAQDTIQLKYSPQSQEQTPPSQHTSEDDGLSMEEVLGGGQQ